MPETYKVLGQAAPALSTLTALYTVPVGASAVIGSLVVAHLGGEGYPSAIYRVTVAVAGAVDAQKQIVLNDLQLAANTDAVHRLGLTLAAGDVVRVYCSDAACSFNLFGTEIAAFATPTTTALYNAHVAAADPHADRAYVLGLPAQLVEDSDVGDWAAIVAAFNAQLDRDPIAGDMLCAPNGGTQTLFVVTVGGSIETPGTYAAFEAV